MISSHDDSLRTLARIWLIYLFFSVIILTLYYPLIINTSADEVKTKLLTLISFEKIIIEIALLLLDNYPKLRFFS